MVASAGRSTSCRSATCRRSAVSPRARALGDYRPDAVPEYERVGSGDYCDQPLPAASATWRAAASTCAAAAIRAEKAAVAAAAAAALPQISVSKPESGQEALPAGATAALPAPIPAPVVQAPLPAPDSERSIPITMGGRTFTAPMRGGEPVPLEPAKSANRPSPTESIAASLAVAATVVSSSSTPDPETTPRTAEAPKPDADKGGGRFGGLGSRLPFGAKPDDTKKDDKSTTVEKPVAGAHWRAACGVHRGR